MSPSTHFRALALALAATTSVVFGSGCYADVGAQPRFVEASAVPANIENAPRTDYEGRPVYYVNDHWYAHDRGRWVYYRCEPQQLIRHRAQVEHAGLLSRTQ